MSGRRAHRREQARPRAQDDRVDSEVVFVDQVVVVERAHQGGAAVDEDVPAVLAFELGQRRYDFAVEGAGVPRELPVQRGRGDQLG